MSDHLSVVQQNPLAAAERAVRLVDDIIQCGVLQGKKVRVSSDGQIVVADALQLVGMSYECAQKHTQRASKKFGTFLSRRRFEGQGQRDVWVTDAQGLIALLSNIKGKKYEKFTSEIRALKDYVTSRFLGGSKTLQAVSDAIAERVDAGPEGTLLSAVREECKQEDSAMEERAAKRRRLANEHSLFKARNGATEATKQATASMVERLNADKADIVHKNILVTRGATNLTPAELKRRLGEKNPRVSARSLMNRGALGAALMWEEIFAELCAQHATVENALRQLESQVNNFQSSAQILGQTVLRDKLKITPEEAREGLAQTEAALNALDAPATQAALPPPPPPPPLPPTTINNGPNIRARGTIQFYFNNAANNARPASN